MQTLALSLLVAALFVLGDAQYCTHRETPGAMGRKIRPLYPALSKEIINYVNNITNTTWTAVKSERFTSLSEIKRILGVNPDPNRFRLPRLCKVLSPEDRKNIPESFDARTQWENCESIKSICDHGECGASWTSASVEAIIDRLCIHKDQRPTLSYIDVVSCCGPLCGSGCDGGIPAATWDYWVYHGLVSGGKEGCKPCPFDACNNNKTLTNKPACQGDQVAPVCNRQCRDGYGVAYDDDKTFGARAYTLNGKDEDQIKHEIMKNGPVQTDFEVFADFITYEKGIYEHSAGPLLGYHSVRIVGWGEEKDVKYWIAANSWSSTWGENGFFRIRRGENHCGFETDVNAGMPK